MKLPPFAEQVSNCKVLEIAAGGDLLVDFDQSRDGELAMVSDALTKLFTRLYILGSIRTASIVLKTARVFRITPKMAQAASESSNLTSGASQAIQVVNRAMETAAKHSNSLTSTIAGVASNTDQASKMGQEAVTIGREARSAVEELANSSHEIGEVINIISSITGKPTF